jgi:signal transduction histidine kinase
MNNFYEELPFGVIILTGSPLKIQFTNFKFIEIFQTEDKISLGAEIMTNFLKYLDRVINKWFIEKNEMQLNEVELIDGRYFNLVITIKEEDVQVFLYEITDSVLYERSQKENKNFAEQFSVIKDMVDSIDMPIGVISFPEMKYELINKKLLYIIECMGAKTIDSIKIMDLTIKDIFEENLDVELYNGIVSAAENGIDFISNEHFITNKERSVEIYRLHFKPHKDEHGKTIKIHMYGTDVTEIVNHNNELKKLTTIKDEFFTIVSHELRTPITIIYASLELAYGIYYKEISPSINKILNRIDQNCSRLLKLINNILDTSKAEAGFLILNNYTFDIINNTEFIVNSVNTYAESKNINLIFDTNIEEANVCIDKDKYEKILLNLLSNSIKFTTEGKKILVSLNVGDKYVYLSVKDQGIGIPKSKLEYIFDRFAQVNNSLSRRAEGTGLGLNLVKKLVELMNGEVNVISKEGYGTEFVIKLERYSSVGNVTENNTMIDATTNKKINIEFSDIY